LIFARTEEFTMADIVSELAAKCGISAEQAQKGLGAVLAFVKEKVPAETFSKISESVPNAPNMISSAAETGKEASAGLVGAVSGLASKIFGGGASELVSKFSQLGLSADQIQSFLPKAIEMLKDKLPEDVKSKLSSILPVK
jgi:hypothetical protein